MIRHDPLTTIHPAKASLQETKPHALTGGHDAAPNQKGGNMRRLCYTFRTECPPLGRYPSYNTDGRATQRNGTHPKSP